MPKFLTLLLIAAAPAPSAMAGALVLTGQVTPAFQKAGVTLNALASSMNAPSWYSGPTADPANQVRVTVYLSPVDGPSGVLAHTGYSLIRYNDYGQFSVGEAYVIMDTDDLSQPESVLIEIAFHELVHCLGFGAMWAPNGITYPGLSADGRHWDELPDPFECMTPVHNAGFTVSRKTIQSLKDLGMTLTPFGELVDNWNLADLVNACNSRRSNGPPPVP